MQPPRCALPVESFEEHVKAHMRAFEEARRREPTVPTGGTFPVARGGITRRLARCHVEATLQNACPGGLGYLYHYLHVAMVDVRAFEAACGHFGLRGVIRDITPGEVAAEVRARRERGDEPSTGLLPLCLDNRFSREEADARTAIVKRRIAEARAAGIPAAAPRAYPAASSP